MIKCTNYIIKVPDLCLLWKALSIQGKKKKPQRSHAAWFGSLLPPQRPNLMQKGSLETVHSERTVTEFAYLCHREPPYICKQLQTTHFNGNMIMPETRKEIHIFSNRSRPASCHPQPREVLCLHYPSPWLHVSHHKCWSLFVNSTKNCLVEEKKLSESSEKLFNIMF